MTGPNRRLWVAELRDTVMQTIASSPSIPKEMPEHTCACTRVLQPPTSILADLGVWRSFMFTDMSVSFRGRVSVEWYLRDANPRFASRLLLLLWGCLGICPHSPWVYAEVWSWMGHSEWLLAWKVHLKSGIEIENSLRHTPKYIHPTVSEHLLCPRDWGFRGK